MALTHVFAGLIPVPDNNVLNVLYPGQNLSMPVRNSIEIGSAVESLCDHKLIILLGTYKSLLTQEAKLKMH